MTTSPEGRRILIAVVTGAIGDEIQRWREHHDPGQARRIPPHMTLVYWAPDIDPALLEAQVCHAFPAPIPVRLGAVRTFGNRDQTRFLPVLDTGALDAARVRLYDGTHLPLAKDRDWEWHVTCVRYGRSRELDSAALAEADSSLPSDVPWLIDMISYMELRDGIYEPIAMWRIGVAS